MDEPFNRYAPNLSAASSFAAETQKQKVYLLDFFICFFSFTALLLQSLFGMLAIIAFMAPWLLVYMRQPRAVPDVMLKNWSLLVLPALTILSTAWSDYRSVSLKGGIEYAVTVGIAILAGHYIKPRVIISALFCSFFLIALLCTMNADQYLYAMSEDAPLTGIFGSKNAFSGMMSLLMLISVAVFVDKGQSKIFRLAAAAAIALTPILLYFGRSLGAVLAVYFTVAVFISVRMIARFKPKMRLLIGAMIFFAAIGIVFWMAVAEINPMSALGMMGKDTTLTGRTHLWSRAIDFIGDRPLLGVGSGAFWQLGNPRAQELWFFCQVPPGSGLGFHNEYINMTIDLGLVGLFVVLGYFYILSRRVILSVLGTMTPEQSFGFLIFIFLMIRTPVESGIFGQFNIVTILFCLTWMYFRPAAKVKVRKPKKAQTNIYVPEKTGILRR